MLKVSNTRTNGSQAVSRELFFREFPKYVGRFQVPQTSSERFFTIMQNLIKIHVMMRKYVNKQTNKETDTQSSS
jgi:hypothetical protein